MSITIFVSQIPVILKIWPRTFCKSSSSRWLGAGWPGPSSRGKTGIGSGGFPFFSFLAFLCSFPGTVWAGKKAVSVQSQHNMNILRKLPSVVFSRISFEAPFFSPLGYPSEAPKHSSTFVWSHPWSCLSAPLGTSSHCSPGKKKSVCWSCVTMTCLFFQRSDLLLLRSVLFLGSPPSLLSKPRTAKCVLNQSSLFVFWKVFHNVKQMQELPAAHFFQTFLLSSFMDMLIPKQWWLITNHWPYGRTHPLRLTAQNSKAAGWLATRLDEAMKCQFVFSTSVLLSLFLTCLSCMNCRRKFRSQTSDNMERWKAEQGRGREKRKIRRKKSRSERGRRQKMQMREKAGKSRNTVFFQWFVAPEGRKVGSLKRRVRTQLARGEMKNCTPLWPEAHFEVKMLKTPGVRTTFGSCDVEKVHAVVARSTFRSQNVQNTPFSDHFWKLRCRKSARRCGAKHISKSKC